MLQVRHAAKRFGAIMAMTQAKQTRLKARIFSTIALTSALALRHSSP
jgi:hypothetical protein